MTAGVATVIFLMLNNCDPLFGWSVGFVALCLNFLITALLSVGNARTPDSRPSATIARRMYTGPVTSHEACYASNLFPA
jgi:hypothetical protein